MNEEMLKGVKHTNARSFCSIIVILHLIILTILLFHAIEAYKGHQAIKEVKAEVELLLDNAGIPHEHLENSE